MTPPPWPSPLPGPAWQKWRNCVDHLERTVLDGVPLETVAALRRLPLVVEAETRAAEMARSGDVLATNASCNAWVRSWRAALKTHMEQEEAA